MAAGSVTTALSGSLPITTALSGTPGVVVGLSGTLPTTLTLGGAPALAVALSGTLATTITLGGNPLAGSPASAGSGSSYAGVVPRHTFAYPYRIGPIAGAVLEAINAGGADQWD